MDIEFLLILQNFRNMTNNFLTPFMECISLFAITYLIMVPALIYWIYDKRKGIFTFANYCLVVGVNAVVKLTACIYRPWIRDPRVLPAGDSIRTATGYSFPSGHVATAGPFYLGMATSFFKEKRWFSITCLALLFLTAFSRNYLGVHTPQDVFIALCESILGVYIMSKIFAYLKEHPEKENLFLILEFLLGVVSLVYIHYKPYPMDYVNGELIVDPQKMMNDGYGDLATMMAFPLARYIEKTWIKFKPLGINKTGIITGICFVAVYAVFIIYCEPALIKAIGSHWGKFVFNYAKILLIFALLPAVIKLITYYKEKKEEGK